MIFFKAFQTHYWLRILFSAFALSTVGSGLTFVVVFAELIALQASPSSLALAFVLSTVPGIFGTFFGSRFLRKFDAAFCILLTEFLSLVGLIVPLLGVVWHNMVLLQMAELVSSIVGGFAIPAMSHYMKVKLHDNELAAGSLMSTLVFGCHVLLGVGLGVCIYPWVNNPYVFLLIDGLSYGLSIGILMLLPKLYTGYSEVKIESLPIKLSLIQKISLNLLPLLASVGSPAMALLPALIPSAMNPKETALPILFARSLGQLVGPVFIRESHLKKPPMTLIALCMVGFLVCYQTVTLSTWFLLSFCLIFFAHILSNIVANLGNYGLLKYFNSEHVAAASINSYRKQLTVMAITGSLAGLLADYIGGQKALLICSGVGLLLSILVLFWLQRTDINEE